MLRRFRRQEYVEEGRWKEVWSMLIKFNEEKIVAIRTPEGDVFLKPLVVIIKSTTRQYVDIRIYREEIECMINFEVPKPPAEFSNGVLTIGW